VLKLNLYFNVKYIGLNEKRQGPEIRGTVPRSHLIYAMFIFFKKSFPKKPGKKQLADERGSMLVDCPFIPVDSFCSLICCA
jgi:hypothetical protein